MLSVSPEDLLLESTDVSTVVRLKVGILPNWLSDSVDPGIDSMHSNLGSSKASLVLVSLGDPDYSSSSYAAHFSFELL